MKNLKGEFKLNTRTVNKMLKSQEVMNVAEKEGAKLGTVEERYVGTQRVWVKGVEK